MDKLDDAIIFRGCPHLDIESEGIPCQSQNSCTKLSVYDWLHDLPHPITEEDLVEVRFKNTRKAYYRNINAINLRPGDMVAVEASPGHDIGMVSLTGPLVYNQLKKYRIRPAEFEFKRIYRKAKQADIEKWKEAIALEHKTMLRSRKITQNLRLDMKIGDVEYQGDKTKAIFYYIADDRVDFRELIKVMAEEFRIRIEMRQIGARQEAGRIG
ncbi:MAG: regulatory iron-sulfur-containing complex subunit RicT, partial [Bacteroidales bacterium]